MIGYALKIWQYNLDCSSISFVSARWHSVKVITLVLLTICIDLIAQVSLHSCFILPFTKDFHGENLWREHFFCRLCCFKALCVWGIAGSMVKTLGSCSEGQGFKSQHCQTALNLLCSSGAVSQLTLCSHPNLLTSWDIREKIFTVLQCIRDK